MKNSRKLTTTFWLVCGYLLIAFSNNARADIFREADSLFNLKQYRDAAIAYEKVAFYYNENEEIKTKSLLKKSECLIAEENYAAIELALQRINTKILKDSLKAEVLFKQAFSTYLTSNFERSKNYILPVLSLQTSAEMYKSASILYSLVLNEQSLWTQSETNLQYYVQALNLDTLQKQELQHQVNMLYNHAPKLKKLKKARTLSFVFPGLGQMYTGNTGKGIASIVLISIASGMIYYNIVNTAYLAGLAGVYLFSNIYIGTINQLHYLIKKENSQKIRSYNDKLAQEIKILFP